MINKAGDPQSAGGPYASLGGIFITLCGAAQGGAMFLAMYYIEQYSSVYREELEKEEPDKEVLKLEEREEAQKKELNKVSKWEVLPSFAKGLLVFGAALTVAYVYMFEGGSLFNFTCFTPFDVTDCIGKCAGKPEFLPSGLKNPAYNKLQGNALNVVQSDGWVAIVFLCVANILDSVFNCWAKRQLPK